MHQGVIKCGMFAGLLFLLTACTTLPAPDSSDSPPAPTAASPTPPAASLPFGPKTPAPMTDDAAPLSEVLVDDKALLAGEAPRVLERGEASWYGPRFQGRRTASGEPYDMHGLTAAHKTLPFGTLVRVRGLLTGREIEVRINDRGPYARGRVIDLSRAAAEALGMLGLGVKEVLLLVPESTPQSAEPAPRPAKKARRITRRAPSARTP